MQFLLTAGMQREKAARAIAMTYTQLIYASIFDFVVNGTIPQGWSLVGEIVIVLAVFSIIYFKEPSPPPMIAATDDGTDNFRIDLEGDVELKPFRDSTSTAPQNIEIVHAAESGDFKLSSESDSDVHNEGSLDIHR